MSGLVIRSWKMHSQMYLFFFEKNFNRSCKWAWVLGHAGTVLGTYSLYYSSLGPAIHSPGVWFQGPNSTVKLDLNVLVTVRWKTSNMICPNMPWLHCLQMSHSMVPTARRKLLQFPRQIRGYSEKQYPMWLAPKFWRSLDLWGLVGLWNFLNFVGRNSVKQCVVTRVK